MAGLTFKIRGQGEFVAIGLRIFLGHPSVFWNFVQGKVRYGLVESGVLRLAAKRLEEVRAAFEANAAHGQFKEAWFDMNITAWCVNFSRIFDRAKPVRILEIGSWEGRSTLFFLTYFTQGHLTAVDTWAGSEEHTYRELQEIEA